MKKINDFDVHELQDLLIDASKNWLAHDGLWFRAVEENFGMEAAMELDKKTWEKFTVIEAKRIMKRLNMPTGGGIPALIQALKFRLYAFINVQEVLEASENRCVFRMNRCRVQEARQRQGLADLIVDRLHLPYSSPDTTEWETIVAKLKDPEDEVSVVIVGKYTEHGDA